jgi:hypothetical protein
MMGSHYKRFVFFIKLRKKELPPNLFISRLRFLAVISNDINFRLLLEPYFWVSLFVSEFFEIS